MALGRPEEIAPETFVHRLGGGRGPNLRLSVLDRKLTPPGISVLLGGTPEEATNHMQQAFPHSRKWRETARLVGTTTARAVRTAGFEILPDPTSRFPNHARLVHPRGPEGFTDDNLEGLAQAFRDTQGG